MKVVVPLAGPDFEREDGRTKSEEIVEGMPLLRRALESRPWWTDGTVRGGDLVFVLRDSGVSRRFQDQALKAWYPESKQVLLTDVARGAALSSLAGVSLAFAGDDALCVDLADILYEADSGIDIFRAGTRVGGKALVFQSTNPAYSYLRTATDGAVVEVAEKKVISTNASAGTYFFANVAIYLAALARNLGDPKRVEHRGAFFVAPVLQGVLDLGFKVEAIGVRQVLDLKMPG